VRWRLHFHNLDSGARQHDCAENPVDQYEHGELDDDHDNAAAWIGRRLAVAINDDHRSHDHIERLRRDRGGRLGRKRFLRWLGRLQSGRRLRPVLPGTPGRLRLKQRAPL
jgi:hypothetical protein